MHTFRQYTDEIYFPALGERKAYRRDLASIYSKHVYPLIGDKAMDAITPRDVYMVYLGLTETGLANPTIASYCRGMYREFCHALETGVISENPYTLHFSNNTSQLIDYPETMEEHVMLLDAIDRLPVKGLFKFSYLSGMAISSLRLIKLSAYNVANRTLTINDRAMRIPKTSYDAIDEELHKRSCFDSIDHDFLFTRQDGSHIPQVDCYSSTLILRSLLNRPSFTASDLWEGYGSMLRVTGGDDWS